MIRIYTDGSTRIWVHHPRNAKTAMPDGITLAAILLYLSLRAAYASWKGL